MGEPRYRSSDRRRERKHGLPRGRAYSVTDHDVPVGDGTILKVSHYAPVGTARGTLATLSPYGRTGAFVRGGYALYAAQGYHVVVASLRGTFGSGGPFDPMFPDADDYRHVISWMRAQPWYTGSFATFGASYLGWTQWTLLTEPQPDHRAAIVTVGPHDFRGFHWGSGTFTSSLPLWAAILDAQETSLARMIWLALAKGKPIYRLLGSAPIADALYEALPRQRRWLEERFVHEADDPYWIPLDLGDALDRVRIPVLISSGWQDVFLAQSAEQFARLRARGVDAAFTVGPWEHTQATIDRRVTAETFEWLDAHLTRSGPARASRVHLHVTGADEWRELEAWPPPTAARRLHLAQDALADAPATGETSFPFDPEDPPVFPGGPLLSGGGYADDTAVAERGDVFAVASAPLGADLEVHGVPVISLDHSSEHADSHLFVRLSDVDERGRSRNVAQGALRVRSDGPVRIELGPIAHRFRAGHRLRIAIAGGAHPHFPSSPGTGENPMLASRRVPGRHTLRFADSHIDLPVPLPQ